MQTLRDVEVSSLRRVPLAALSLLLGLAAAPFARRLATATEALDADSEAHLTLWPGLHLPLLLRLRLEEVVQSRKPGGALRLHRPVLFRREAEVYLPGRRPVEPGAVLCFVRAERRHECEGRRERCRQR